MIEIAIQVSSALVAAHQAGVVHRDIKPDNIMRRADGIVKVLDFGLAKLLEKPAAATDSAVATRALVQTDAGVVMGTASYMSPEQARGDEMDARTDIWSLGVVLYEMVAGRLPYEGATANEAIARILERDPAPLVRYAPELPAELERIITKALTKNREERYQTAKDLLVDLKRLQQRLELESEIERVHGPAALVASTASGQVVNEPTSPPVAGTTIIHSVSSAEYVVTNLKRHKFTAVVALLLVAAAAGGLWRYFHSANTRGPIESIAVLPFVNASGNSEIEYLSDGMTGTLISSLSRLPNLNVKPRSSVFRYKGKEINLQTVGKELNVQAILNGRVVQQGQELSLFVELIDVALDKVVWSQQYNRKQADLVSLQIEIARDVSRRLTKLSGVDEAKVAKTYTANPEANELYLRGRFFQRKAMPQDLDKAVEYFLQAITRDHNFAPAYAGLANAYATLSDLKSLKPRDYMLKAKDAAQHALLLDDQLVEAHIALGYILFEYDYAFAGAEQEFKRASELNPNDPDAHQAYGELLTYLGRQEESLAELRRSLEIDPLSLGANCAYGASLSFARRYDEAIAQLKRTLELDNSYWLTHYNLAITYNMKGDHKESVAERIKINELFNKPQTVALMGESFAKEGWDGFLRAMLGSEERHSQLPPYIIATFHVELGEQDKALAILNQLYEDHSANLVLLKVDPRLDPLRADQRFKDLLRRVGFAQ